jgi:hypothetical protein
MTGAEVEVYRGSAVARTSPSGIDMSKLQPGDEIFIPGSVLNYSETANREVHELLEAGRRAGATIVWHESIDRNGFVIRFD